MKWHHDHFEPFPNQLPQNGQIGKLGHDDDTIESHTSVSI